MRKDFLPFAKPEMGAEEISSVKEVLESGWLASGPKNAELERNFKYYIGCRYAIAVNSGTSGLLLALKALGIPEGEVITPSMSFVATSNIILENGLKPCFVDIKRETINLNENLIKVSDKTKAIIPVHFNGLACNMEAISGIKEKHGLYVIEDAAHAIGAACNGKKVGVLSDITVFSLHPNKNITSGEGGIITTNDKKLADTIKSLRYFGFKPVEEDGRTRYEQAMSRLSLKFNLPDIQAAIAIEQLKKVDSFNAKRKMLVKAYEDLIDSKFCKKYNVQKPVQELDSTRHVHHMYQIFVEQRDKVIQRMKKHNIGLGIHYTPIHLQPYYQNNNCWRAEGSLKETEWVGERTVTLPLFTKMEEQDVQDVVEALKQCL